MHLHGQSDAQSPNQERFDATIIQNGIAPVVTFTGKTSSAAAAVSQEPSLMLWNPDPDDGDDSMMMVYSSESSADETPASSFMSPEKIVATLAPLASETLMPATSPDLQTPAILATTVEHLPATSGTRSLPAAENAKPQGISISQPQKVFKCSFPTLPKIVALYAYTSPRKWSLINRCNVACSSAEPLLKLLIAQRTTY